MPPESGGRDSARTGGVAYGYDDNGNLISRGHSRTFAGNTAVFTWDAARSIPQVLDDETFRYVYGLGRIAQVSGTATPTSLRATAKSA